MHTINYLYNSGFPIEFFTSKYYIIIDKLEMCDYLKKTKVLSNILEVFYNNQYVNSKFKKFIELEEDYKAIRYERIKPVDDKKIFIEQFSYDYNEFYHLFVDKLKNTKMNINK